MTTRQDAWLQRKRYWDKLVEQSIERCATLLVKQEDKAARWLCYLLEVLDVQMGTETVDLILQKLRNSIDVRLEQGEW